MKKLTRRQFIGTAAMSVAASHMLTGCADGEQYAEVPAVEGPKPFNRPVSFQSYGMRRQIEEDFPGTLKKVQELGYAGVEMCSPIGYEQAGFGNLTPLPPTEIKQQIADSGLFCRTSHFGAREMLGDATAASVEYGAAMGLTDIIMSGAGVPRDGTLDDYKTFCEEANTAGEVVKSMGLRLGYHNHAIGPEFDGKPLYDYLMELLDPELVTMQFQLASIADGYDIVSYLDKYAGRYSALHIHDWDPEAESSRPDRMGTVVPVGEGMIDWHLLITTALKSDIADHGFIIEIETEEPFEGLKRSIDFLKTVEV